MAPNDLSSYQIPLRDDVRRLSEGGFVDQALVLINYLLEKENLDTLQRERLELEAHRLPIFKKEYPFSEEEALALANNTGLCLDQSSLKELCRKGTIPWALIDGKLHLNRRFLETLQKGKVEKEPDIRNLVRQKMCESGHAEAKIKVHVGLSLKPEAYRKGKVLDVELPIPVASPFMSDLQIVAQSGQLVGMSPTSHKRRVAHFSAIPKPDEEFWIEYQFTNTQRFYDLSLLEGSCTEKVHHSKPEPPYLLSTPYLSALAKEIVGEEQNPIRKARAIYQWVISHISYVYMPSYQTISNLAEYGILSRHGDCGIQASIFINLAREAGIKSDWMGGMYVTPDGVGNHDWASMQFPGIDHTFYVDCSFGGSAYRKGDYVLSGFYFGNLDVMRIPCTTLLAPGPGKIQGPWRNDPTDSQRGEAWYGNETIPNEYLVDTRRTISFKLR